MNKRISILPFLLAVGATAGSIRGNRRLSNEVLFAKYDWLDGAKDVSNSQVRHDGTLDNGVSTNNGALSVHTGYGVDLGIVPELDGASNVLFRFENVRFTNLPDGSQYSVLLGGVDWWVGVDHNGPSHYDPGTYLIFNVGGWGYKETGFDYDFEVKVDDGSLEEFASIEYRFDGTKGTEGRLAVRYNDGDWVEGGWTSADFDDPSNFDPSVFSKFPVSLSNLKINDGWRADWDDWDGSVGTISLSASPPSSYFHVYDGACRMNANGTGSGRNHNQYEVYNRVNDPNVDYEWCKTKCESQADCSGFEYRDSYSDAHCEIWRHRPILGFEAKPDHYCVVKLDRNHIYNENLGVCRNTAGEKGRSGNEYDLYLRTKIPVVDYQWCIKKCSEDPTCIGIEGRWAPVNLQQCEIWHSAIGSVVNMPNSNCNMKVYA